MCADTPAHTLAELSEKEPSTIMKFLRLLGIAALLVALLTGCSSSSFDGPRESPEVAEAAQDVLEAFTENDFATVCDLTTSRFKSELWLLAMITRPDEFQPGQACESRMEQWYSAVAVDGGAWRVDGATQVDATTGKAGGVFYYNGGGSTNAFILRMVLEEGKWKWDGAPDTPGY